VRRWLGGIVLGALLALLVLLAFAFVRARQVRGDLTEARREATRVQRQLVQGDLELATNALPSLRHRLDRAAARTESPLWALAERVPVAGGNVKAVRRVALAAQILGDEALPEAAAALEVARRQKVIQSGRVDLAVLARLSAHLDRAARASARAQTLVDTRQRLLLPSVADGVGQARERVGQLDAALSSAQRALLVAPAMLGQSGPRHYFVAVQNNAEARATGGLIGAFALVTTDHGLIRLERTGTNTELKTAAKHVPSDPKAAKLWKGLGSTGAWYAANFTPHFPDAASNIAGLWEAQSGQRVDGVLALDPVVMSELLRATGAVRLRDGRRVDASSVGPFVWHDEYLRYPDLAERKDVLSSLAGVLFRKVVLVREPLPLIRAFTRVGQSGHFFVWSRHADEQAQLAKGRVGGLLPKADVPYLSVLTQNFAGNKLDYYVRRRVSVRSVGAGQIEVEVRLRNEAPPGLPAYIAGRSDTPKRPLPYAQAGMGFTIYGARSSTIDALWVNGTRVAASFDWDHGHRMATVPLELPRGEEITVTVRMTEPGGVLTYRQQPLVRADTMNAGIDLRS
jgi:hypothetical protein